MINFVNVKVSVSACCHSSYQTSFKYITSDMYIVCCTAAVQANLQDGDSACVDVEGWSSPAYLRCSNGHVYVKRESEEEQDLGMLVRTQVESSAA